MNSNSEMNVVDLLSDKNATDDTTGMIHASADTQFKFLNAAIMHRLFQKCDPSSNTSISLCPIQNVTNFRNIVFPEVKSSDTFLSECPTTQWIDRLIVISHLLLAINSSANVIIYLFIGN